MGFHDYAPMFCDDCGVALSLMMDQHGTIVIACGCPDGVRELDASNEAWAENRGHRLETPNHD